MNNRVTESFFELVRAGLWERDARLSRYCSIDFEEFYRLAEEQSVVGLVAAGIEHIEGMKFPQKTVLMFAGNALRLEQRNDEMNLFVAELTRMLRGGGVSSVLVKGQGVAQCYERPLWRAAGDVDLLLDAENYEKAKRVLLPISYGIQAEDKAKKHLAMKIKGFDVELHGRMPFELSRRADIVVDAVIEEALSKRGVCAWRVDDTDVLLPNPDNHLFLVFTHYLHHFFIEGVGLRQICDWCRLLWTYRDSLDLGLLEQRVRDAGLMSEWRVFAALAVDVLGMPIEAMPFYKKGYEGRARRVLRHVLKSGNFGHSKDLSYRVKYKRFAYKMVSLWRRFVDFAGMTFVFPVDAPRFFGTYVFGKLKV